MADIGASNWNEADASNSTAAPDGWPEGMAPSGVNDSGRAMMGAVKRFYDWTNPLLTAGSSTAYTLTYSVAPGALVDGMSHLVQFNAANGVAATLNVNALGAKPLQYYAAGSWLAIPSGLLGANQVARVAYNAAAGAYRLIDLRNRTGEVVPYAGATAPEGSLLCFGQAISRTDFVGLFTAISTLYGTGDGSTTFNLPDLRGRVAAGKDDMGGSAASRLNGTVMTPDAVTLGANGGHQSVTTINSTANGTAGGDFTAITLAQVLVVQPTMIFNYIIKL